MMHGQKTSKNLVKELTDAQQIKKCPAFYKSKCLNAICFASTIVIIFQEEYKLYIYIYIYICVMQTSL
jgi:hypothetical protein